MKMAAAVVILVACCVVLAGCSREGKRDGVKQVAKKNADGKQLYTREEFRQAFLGATLEEVRAKLGAPDKVDIAEDRWEYFGRTMHPDTGEIDRYVSISHKDGRVVSAGAD